MKFERLKQIRKEKKLTQKDVAKILNVERSTYTGWENGKDTIPLKKLIKLCNYYKCSIDYIMNITNNNIFISYQDSSIIVGKNLNKMRIEKLLKQKDIYSFLNISSSSYSSYETGNILIQTESIYKIAKKYNYSVDKLLKK